MVGGALLAGCGGSSNTSSSSGSTSKPAYCSAVSNLENSITPLPSAAEGKATGRAGFSQVQQDGTTAVNQPKSDFSNLTLVGEIERRARVTRGPAYPARTP
jgi:hypothetical protein